VKGQQRAHVPGPARPTFVARSGTSVKPADIAKKRTILAAVNNDGIYVTTQRDGFDFNLAYIGPDFQFENKKEEFDTLYMRALFDYGYHLGRQGYPWKKTPPGLETQLGLRLKETRGSAPRTTLARASPKPNRWGAIAPTETRSPRLGGP
jgi:hypothetical protein